MGFLDRKAAKFTDGCVIDLQPGQCFVMTVPMEKHKGIDNSNDWVVQCVLADNPGAGMIPQNLYAYTADKVAKMDMLLKCDHDQDPKLACAEGSNSDRTSAWDKQLKSKKLTMYSTCAQQVNSGDQAEFNDKKFFCQYYNNKAKKVLFATEYMHSLRK